MPRPASIDPTSPIASAGTLPLSEWTLLCSWVPMIGNWLSVECSDARLCARAAFEHEPEHGHEHEQQGEQREEAVVGDQRPHLAGLVVVEALEDGHDEAESPAALLVAVEGA